MSVVIQYRLGFAGFLSSNAFRAESPVNSTGNYGFMDQQFALAWVQNNGAAFGGDISDVTIYGESAGAGSVSLHVIAPQSFGLFHRGISESGPIADWIAQPLNISVLKYFGEEHLMFLLRRLILLVLSLVDIATKTACCSPNSCDDADPAVAACLRTVSTADLLVSPAHA